MSDRMMSVERDGLSVTVRGDKTDSLHDIQDRLNDQIEKELDREFAESLESLSEEIRRRQFG